MIKKMESKKKAGVAIPVSDKTDFKTTKNKISLAWWCTPVIPGTRVAEAGESLQTGRQRLW